MFFRKASTGVSLVESFSRVRNALGAAERITIRGRIPSSALSTSAELRVEAMKSRKLSAALNAIGINRRLDLKTALFEQRRDFTTTNLPKIRTEFLTDEEVYTLTQADMIRIDMSLQGHLDGKEQGEPINIKMMTVPAADISFDDLMKAEKDQSIEMQDISPAGTRPPKSVKLETGEVEVGGVIINKDYLLLAREGKQLVVVDLEHLLSFQERRMSGIYRKMHPEKISTQSPAIAHEQMKSLLVELYGGFSYAGPSGGPGEQLALFKYKDGHGNNIPGDMLDLIKSEESLSKTGSRLSGVNSLSPIHDQRVHFEQCISLTNDNTLAAESEVVVGTTEMVRPDGRIVHINGSHPRQILIKNAGEIKLSDGRRIHIFGEALEAVADVASQWAHDASSRTFLSKILRPLVSSKDEDPIDSILPFVKRFLTSLTPKPWAANRHMYIFNKEGEFETLVFSGRSSKWPNLQQLLKVMPTDGSEPFWVNATGICTAGTHSHEGDRGGDVTNALSVADRCNALSFAVDVKTKMVRPATDQEIEHLERAFQGELEIIHGESFKISDPCFQLMENWRSDKMFMTMSDGSLEKVYEAEPYLDIALGSGDSPFEASQAALETLRPDTRYVVAAKQLDSQLMRLVAKNKSTIELAQDPVMQSIYRGEPTTLSEKESILTQLLPRINSQRHSEIRSNFDYSVKIINEAALQLDKMPVSLVKDDALEQRLK